MGDKRNLRYLERGRRSQRKDATSYKNTISKILHTRKQALLTSSLLILIVVLLFAIVGQLQPPATSTPPKGATGIDYSSFVSQVKGGNVLAVIIRGNEIHGLLASPPGASATVQSPAASSADITTWSYYVSAGYSFQSVAPVRASSTSPSQAASTPQIDTRRCIYTLLPGSGDASLMPLLLRKHVVVSTLPVVMTSIWLKLLWNTMTFLFFVLLLMSLLTPRTATRSPGTLDDHLTQAGKSYIRRFEPVKETPSRSKDIATPHSDLKAQGSLAPPVTFADVAGIDEVRRELEEIVQFLCGPERFQRLGARIPRGALLVGPPGTGKTLLAKAVAGEAGVPFFSISGSEFVEVFAGVGAKRVRELFHQARQAGPCVVFIDELDAVGRQRSMSVMGSDERDQTLNQLLVELDGFADRQTVVVLTATNRVDILDKALLRPGRFDRQIAVALPDRLGRKAILKVHTRHTPLHEDVSLEHLSRLTSGMSGADLANLVNEAALAAARQNLEQVTARCFEDALARIQLGTLRPLALSEADRRILAFHEGGHALVAYHLPQADSVNRVTILPRGQSLGVTQFTASEDRYNYSRETLLARIAVGLGGRAAEALAFGPDHVTTGAENDLQAVTALARQMVTRWGMSQRIGVVYTVSEPAARKSGSSMATLIDQEMQHILNEGYTMSQAILREHAKQLALLADALMEHEQLDRTQFEALLSPTDDHKGLISFR